MAVTWTVQADTEAEARSELARLCETFGLTPLGRPMFLPGRGEAERWMARATERPITVRSRDVRQMGAG